MAIAGNKITRAKIDADAIDGTKVADDSLDSEHYAATSIDNEHLADNAVGTDEIANSAVTYAKIQNVSATDRILGRDSASAGVIEEITPANLRTMINVADGANAYVHPNHSGEVTSTADGATVIADNIVDEANLKVSNAPVNGYMLTAQSGDTGGLTWAEVGSTDLVNDTTPQLGGDLDLNGNNIDFPTTANISDVKDEDNMASNSATMLATQQSIKAYVDTTVAAATANASEMGTQHMWIPAAAMRPRASNGCASITDAETTSGRPDMQVLDFDASSDEHAQFTIAMPSSWNEGTITYQVYWTSTATDTDGVAWGLQGVCISDNDTMDVAYGTAVVVTDDALGAAEDLCVTAVSSAVTLAGSPAAGDLAAFQIFRDVSDGNDDMAEDARLVGIKLIYITDASTDS